ncbi:MULTISPECIES: AraC family transcriptional regulator [unclassified Lentimicrobium]|uniref:helix-turn-helix domain-containing protein n=1 Tax=unclassified Lentimicrobium TaxID=2677434 RepID=UPI00155588E0|nr:MULTISPECIES: AraC family transcriptional regulator [unclassified Lentimicrobium]NPD45846.1 helix-turn-helix transcriptional regulator [Lentimicrobium sp. S6]NPD86596.1 helix-turn-helix transcriptional regulator [Lentimicrobium sp. L6]
MIEIFPLTFFILFIVYISFGIIIHSISTLNSSKDGLGYVSLFYYSRAFLFLGPAMLLFTNNIGWSVYYSGPLKVLMIPLLYLYFSKLDQENKKLKKGDLTHLLPFFFEILFTLPIACLHAEEIANPESIKISSILSIQWDENFYFNLLAITARSIALIQAIIYSILISRTYIKLKKSFLDHNSFVSFTNLNWIKWVSYLFIINGFISGFELFGLFNIPIIFVLTALFLLFIAFYFLIYSILQKTVYYKSSIHSEQHIHDIEDDIKEESNIILNKFKDQQLYLLQDICLQEASNQLGIAKYKLSKYVKIGGYENFYHFVNMMRVNTSKELLRNISHQYSIDSVVTDSGFNSRSTFYRVFKEYCEMTPTEYIKQSKEIWL